MALSQQVRRLFEPKMKKIAKRALENDFLLFCVVFFEVLEDCPLLIGQHHRVLCDTLVAVSEGKYKRLIVNIPPGYSKTLFVSILWPAWCMARYGKCRFLPISYSKDLVLRNSEMLKKIVFSNEFRYFWNLKEHGSTKSKQRWMTTRGDEVYCASSKGAVTGFRAGSIDKDKFTGAMLIDDALKPGDGFSKRKRREVNRNFDNTLRSRLACEDTPIVIIMQRLHEDDLVGYLLNGQSIDQWHVLKMPVLIDNSRVDIDTSHAIYLKHGLSEGPLWSVKHTLEDIDMLKKDRLTYASQYDQNPVSIDASMIDIKNFGRYDFFDEEKNFVHGLDGTSESIVKKIITVDTALTQNTTSDYSAFVLAGLGAVTGKVYILDVTRGRFEPMELKRQYLEFCKKHTTKLSAINERWTELQAAGYGLVSDINKTNPHCRLEGIKRVKDKVSRVAGVIPSICEGKVFLPYKAHWLSCFEDELSSFNENMTHKNDDMVDAFCDSVDILLGGDSGSIDSLFAMFG